MRWYEAFAWRFPGFSLAATRAFWWFVVWILLVGAAALNTGNNALYMLLSLSLGAFVASGVLSRHTLAHLRGEISFPQELWAGASCQVRVTVRNSSSWLPAWGVVTRLENLPGGLVLPPVPPAGQVTATLVTKFPRRGLYPKPSLVLEVRLPLGFFVKSLRLPSDGTVLVYPSLVPAALPRLAGPPQSESSLRPGRNLRGGEVEFLREFRPGDDIRDVHWKQTARQQQVIVMERRERERQRQYLVLDPRVANPQDPELQRRFDDLVAEVASVARKLVLAGDAVGLVVGRKVVPPAWGPEHLRRLLTELALVEPVPYTGQEAPFPLREAASYRLVGDS